MHGALAAWRLDAGTGLPRSLALGILLELAILHGALASWRLQAGTGLVSNWPLAPCSTWHLAPLGCPAWPSWFPRPASRRHWYPAHSPACPPGSRPAAQHRRGTGPAGSSPAVPGTLLNSTHKVSTLSYTSQLSPIRWPPWPSWPPSSTSAKSGRGPMVFLALLPPIQLPCRLIPLPSAQSRRQIWNMAKARRPVRKIAWRLGILAP